MTPDTIPFWFAIVAIPAAWFTLIVLTFRSRRPIPNPDELSRADVLERVGSREFTKAGA